MDKNLQLVLNSVCRELMLISVQVVELTFDTYALGVLFLHFPMLKRDAVEVIFSSSLLHITKAFFALSVC